MARRDAIASVFLLALGATAVYEAAKLPFGTLRNPGPGFLPWWESLTLGLLALVLLVQSLTSPPSAHAPEGRRVLKVWGLLAALGAYIFLLENLGYPFCTFLLVLFLLRVVDPHRWATALGIALIAAGGSYLVFAIWLKVPLPAGLLAR